MEGKQLSFDNLFTPPPKTQTKAVGAGAIDKDFLIGAALLMQQWGISKSTTKLALGILNHGNKPSTKATKSSGK